MSYRGICAASALLLSLSFVAALYCTFYVSRDVNTSLGVHKVRLSRKLISIRVASLQCRCHVDGERKPGVWLQKKQTSRFDQLLAFLDLCQPAFREPLPKQNTPVETEHDLTNNSEAGLIADDNTQTTTPHSATIGDDSVVIPPPPSSPLVCQMLIILLVLSATIAIVEVCRASLFTGEKKNTFPISGGGIARRPKPGLGETGRRCSLADLTLSRHARRESLISSNSQSKLSESTEGGVKSNQIWLLGKNDIFWPGSRQKSLLVRRYSLPGQSHSLNATVFGSNQNINTYNPFPYRGSSTSSSLKKLPLRRSSSISDEEETHRRRVRIIRRY